VKKHPFDAVSFVFGILFLGFGLPLLLSDSDLSGLKASWLFPAFLVFAGVVLLISTSGSSKPEKSDSESLD